MIEMNLVKVLVPWLVAFLVGIFITPTISEKLYKYKAWRKGSRNPEITLPDPNGVVRSVTNKDGQGKKTPRMGGLVIVFSVFLTVSLFWLTSFSTSGGPSGKIDFLSRSQTWLPFFAFLSGALVGFFDDYFTIKKVGIFKWGFPLKYRLVFVVVVGLFASWWFYVKLGINYVHVPFWGDLSLGWLFIPFFILVFVATFATCPIDGLDGLSGGIMTIVYSAMGFISFFQDRLDISAFCFVVSGAILAFLWFNIPPALFYMGEVGYHALSFALVVVAFMTETVLLLPVIAFPLFATLFTSVMQVSSIHIFKKRIFKIAPIHHHFEALGWPTYNVVMRYWIVSVLTAVLGVILAVIAI